MDKTKSRTRRKWTYSDRIRLAEMWRDGESMKQIASSFGVTPPAINTQIVRMRATKWDVPRRTWKAFNPKELSPPKINVLPDPSMLIITILMLAFLIVVLMIVAQGFK